MFNNQPTKVERKVNPEADENPKYRTEHTTFSHVKPRCVALYDGHGSKALKVHVDGIEKGEDSGEGARELFVGNEQAFLLCDCPGDDTHEKIHEQGATSQTWPRDRAAR